MSKIILDITDTDQVGIYIGGKNSRYDNRKSALERRQAITPRNLQPSKCYGLHHGIKCTRSFI